MLKKYSSEKIILSIILIAAIFLFIRMNLEDSRLNKQGVYVIGKLVKSEFGGSENGWMYEYEYFFLGVRYTRSFSGPLSSNIPEHDSLLFFRILPNDPRICRQKDDIRVPICYRNLDFKRKFWKKILSCSD